VQVSDNGSGIERSDLGLLCTRHATSKLRAAEDLRSIGTFGFRGEALASCAQVARVEITTRAAGSEAAWKAHYVLGKLHDEPQPCAGNQGTIVHVRDLFYGQRVRREALQASSDEYQKIVHVVQAYAMDRAGRCAFVLNRRGRDRPDFTSQTGSSRVEAAIQVVRGFQSEAVASALLPVSLGPGTGLRGLFGLGSRTTFHGLKQAHFTLFLNGRLIDHAALKRACLQAYSQHLPNFAAPFLFLSLDLAPDRIDVNVHPNKRQVFFLDEDEVVDEVVAGLQEQILAKQYLSQSFAPLELKPGRLVGKSEQGAKTASTRPSVDAGQQPSIRKISTLYPSQKVLVDHGNHRIDTFLFHARLSDEKAQETAASTIGVKVVSKSAAANEGGQSLNVGIDVPAGKSFKDALLIEESTEKLLTKEALTKEALTKEALTKEALTKESLTKKLFTKELLTKEPPPKESLTKEPLTEETLTTAVRTSMSNGQVSSQTRWSQISAQTMKRSQGESDRPVHFEEALLSFQNECHLQIGELLRSSLVVGIIDADRCLLQSGTALLLGETGQLATDMFTSLLLQPPRLGHVQLAEPMTLEEAFSGQLQDCGAETVNEAALLLKSQRSVLVDGLGLSFDEDFKQLLGVPQLIPGQVVESKTPAARKLLQTFLIRLCLVPDYNAKASDSNGHSSETIRSVAQEMASLLSLLALSTESVDWQDYLKHVVLPQLRDPRLSFRMVTETTDAESLPLSASTPKATSPLLIITNTAALYRSFERC
jgi:DNA mismatch repair protein MutL